MTITEYHRPESMEEALKLLKRKTPGTIPLGGGTSIDYGGKEALSVVDLQKLEINKIDQEGAGYKVGAMVTLQTLLDSSILSVDLANAIQVEASLNRRQVATLGGTLIASDGRSPLASVFLAMDTDLEWQPGDKQIGLGDWLASRNAIARKEMESPGLIMTALKWSSRLSLSFDYVARTPKDKPIVCAAASAWSSGRRRLAIGGFGASPVLVLDGAGLDADGAEQAVRDACLQSGDEWASSTYRQEAAVVLTKRCLSRLLSGK